MLLKTTGHYKILTSINVICISLMKNAAITRTTHFILDLIFDPLVIYQSINYHLIKLLLIFFFINNAAT